MCNGLDNCFHYYVSPQLSDWAGCHPFSTELCTGQLAIEHLPIMPTTVSFQPKNKKEYTIVGHIVLSFSVTVTHIEKCPCVPLICFCVFRNSVLVVATSNLNEASSDILLAVNAEACPRRQQRIL